MKHEGLKKEEARVETVSEKAAARPIAAVTPEAPASFDASGRVDSLKKEIAALSEQEETAGAGAAGTAYVRRRGVGVARAPFAARAANIFRRAAAFLGVATIGLSAMNEKTEAAETNAPPVLKAPQEASKGTNVFVYRHEMKGAGTPAQNEEGNIDRARVTPVGLSFLSLVENAKREIKRVKTAEDADWFLKTHHDTFAAQFKELERAGGISASTEDFKLIAFSSRTLLSMIDDLKTDYKIKGFDKREKILRKVLETAEKDTSYAEEKKREEVRRRAIRDAALQSQMGGAQYQYGVIPPQGPVSFGSGGVVPAAPTHVPPSGLYAPELPRHYVPQTPGGSGKKK